MTSQEINFSTVSTEINWLREIAYQLAKHVEQQSEVIQLMRIQVSRMNNSSGLADPQPGKRDADREPVKTPEEKELADYEDQLAKGWVDLNTDLHTQLSKAADQSRRIPGPLAYPKKKRQARKDS